MTEKKGDGPDQFEGQRDPKGRFLPGNKGGPGGPNRKKSELRRAAEGAITPDHVSAMLRRATRMALEGDLTAMRIVLDRTCGRPPEAPNDAEAMDIDPPRLATTQDCNEAIERLISGICDGTVDRDGAKLLTTAIQVRLKAIEMTELEERLTALEQVSATVDETKS